MIRKTTLLDVAVAFGVGAVTAGVWASFTKQNIEATYRTGAANLRRELETRGGALRGEIAQLAADSAIEAIRDEVADFGITAGMLSDLQTAVEAAEAVRAGAIRAGTSVEQYIARIRNAFR